MSQYGKRWYPSRSPASVGRWNRAVSWIGWAWTYGCGVVTGWLLADALRHLVHW